MSIQAAQLYALVGVQGAGQSVRDLNSVSGAVNRTQGVLNGLSKNAGQVGKGMVQVGQGLLRIGEYTAVAAVGAVVASAKVGTSFQAMTELIHTQAGASQDEVDKMRIAIQAMVHEVGTSPTELAKGLYHIESVGVRGAAALDILKASALGAKVGLADMESVTNALTAVWFSGIKGAKSMTDAMAILDGIVGVGNMHLQDLTDSFKSGILGTSATYGVDIRSLGAAIATLTDAGVPAVIATTRLNNTLTHMAAPVKGAITVMQKLGLGQFQLANDMRKPDGLFVALKDLHDHLVAAGEIKNGILTPQGAADLSKLFGGSRFGATAMQLLTQMDRVQQKYDLITQRSQTFGQNVQATMETAGFKFGQLKADIEEAAIAFSDGFLPALARAGSKLDGFLVGHTGDIRKLGVDLGSWLDRIDWSKVENGANTFLGVMKSILDIVSKIPPQVDAAVVGFIGLNKLSGGLVGKGVENIAGGLLGGLGTLGKGALRGLLSKVPVVGGAAAALTSTPVFVTNWPGGFGLGGPGGVTDPLAVVGGKEGLLPKVLALSFGAAVLAAAVPIGEAFAKALPDSWKGPAGSTGKTQSQLAHEYIQAQIEYNKTHPLLPFNTGLDLHRLQGQYPTRAIDFTPAPGNATPNFSRLPYPTGAIGNVTPQISRLTGAIGEMGAAAGRAASFLGASSKLTRELGMDLHTMLGGIKARSEAKYGHAPSASAVQGTFGRDLLDTEKRILSSHIAAKDQLSGLRHLEQLAVQGKDWGVAAKLKTDIAALKTKLSHDVTSGTAGTTAAVKAKKSSFHITVPIYNTTTVSLRDIQLRAQSAATFGRIFVPT